MIKLTIEANDIKTLLVHETTRKAATEIIKLLKLSKYSYTGAEAKNGVFYYVELGEKAVKKLFDLIMEENNKSVTNLLLSELDIAFVIQLVKKINKVGGE